MKEGKEFLWSIYNSGNINYYTISCVFLIVEFLQVALYHLVLYCFERYVALILGHKSEPDENG
jgi:hypothetical protein